jgi:translation elongation factor EF-Ts
VHRVQSNGDLQGAIDFLRQKGMATAAKKVHLLVGVTAAHNTSRPGQTCGVLSDASRAPCWVANKRAHHGPTSICARICALAFVHASA